LSTPEAILPVAVMAAEQDLSASLGVPVEEIQVVSYEQREWPDACLGLASEGEVCAQVITPGWQVVLRAQGEQYVFRTDEDGQVVRQEE
jgi:demethoxyubiquinone hydroxylase (CLK1/Coq7/Cat5 family)